MKRIENYETVQASTGEIARPSAGGYFCKITNVVDVPYDEKTNKGDYLKIEYDFVEGDFKDYYKEAHEKFGGEWWAKFIRSYKEKALGMFKHFTNCVEESNSGYKWEWDEKSLIGKLVGLVLGEEEYEANDGSIKKRLYVKDIKTTFDIANKNYKVPELKRVERKENNTGFAPIPPADDSDLPF